MTDSTSHNLSVIDQVCEEYKIAAPKLLICNIYPLMMFQRKVEDVFYAIHDKLVNKRLAHCFLVGVDFGRENFIRKTIKCLTCLINKDFSAKPWNRSKHFLNFIKPKQNKFFSEKDHRFNRLFECCCSLVYYFEDITSYLETYQSVINGITILDRSFTDMPLLKVIFAATSLIGIHLSGPFYALIKSTATNYSTLLEVFPQIHSQLKTIPVSSYMQTDCRLLSVKTCFLECRPKQEILLSISKTVEEHIDKIKTLLGFMLEEISHDLEVQRGAIFGFSEHRSEVPLVSKISEVTKQELAKLNKATIHNLAEERSVGSINYELGIRGKTNLKCASRKFVKQIFSIRGF